MRGPYISTAVTASILQSLMHYLWHKLTRGRPTSHQSFSAFIMRHTNFEVGQPLRSLLCYAVTLTFDHLTLTDRLWRDQTLQEILTNQTICGWVMVGGFQSLCHFRGPINPQYTQTPNSSEIEESATDWDYNKSNLGAVRHLGFYLKWIFTTSRSPDSHCTSLSDFITIDQCSAEFLLI